MKSFILKADLLSPDHKITFRGETSTKTFCGVLTTLIVGGVILAATVFFSMEIFVREAPISRSISRQSEDSTIMIEDYPLILSFSVNAADFVTNSIQDDFVISAMLFKIDITKENAASMSILKIEPCKAEFFLTSQEIFYKENSHHNLCINPFEMYDLSGNLLPEKPSLSKDFGEHLSQSINIRITRKPSLTEEIFKQKYRRISFVLSMAERFVDVENYDNPIKIRLISHRTVIDNRIVTSSYIKTSKDTLRTDSGVFFENYGEEEYLTFKKIEFKYTMNEADNLVSEIFFVSSTFASIQSREYLKIQTVFAQIGGITKAATLIAKVIVGIASKYKFYSKYSNIIAKEKVGNSVIMNNSRTELNRDKNQFRENKSRLSLWKFLFWRKESFNKHFIPKNSLKELFDIDRINKLLLDKDKIRSGENSAKPEIIARLR